MINVEVYMNHVVNMLRSAFGNRLNYVGLQGSYLRGEATDSSDIDVVVVIDELDLGDLKLYREIISKLDEPEKACGFVCGRKELQNWNLPEICNFSLGTRDYYGRLSDYIPEFSRDNVVDFIKLSVGNLLHGISHSYLHTDIKHCKEILPLFYKNVFFILQNVYYLKTGVFYLTKKELVSHLSDDDADVFNRAEKIKIADDFCFEAEFSVLFNWCQKILVSC